MIVDTLVSLLLDTISSTPTQDNITLFDGALQTPSDDETLSIGVVSASPTGKMVNLTCSIYVIPSLFLQPKSPTERQGVICQSVISS